MLLVNRVALISWRLDPVTFDSIVLLAYLVVAYYSSPVTTQEVCHDIHADELFETRV